MTDDASIERVVILADETAAWKIGGLRQLDRLVLALQEFALASGRTGEMKVLVFWKPGGPDHWLPKNSPLCRVQSAASLPELGPGYRVLSTRLFLARRGLSEFFRSGRGQGLEELRPVSTETWDLLAEAWTGVEAGEKWRVLRTQADGSLAEGQLLGGAGKSQDGLVSRYLNRPISRMITRQLLKWPITPTAWTLGIFVFPLLAFLVLLRGDYAGFLLGALLYHVHSILDGCDGEIARAKFSESNLGGWIDDCCDIVGCCLFVIGLGFGLWRHGAAAHAWLYAAEGLLCALIMAANEWVLHKPRDEAPPESKSLSKALYPRHRQLLERAGLGFLNERVVWLFVQITKRDVGIVIFILLALLNQAQWILHLSFIGPALTLSLSALARLAPARGRAL
jgi:phosphatidylglycerophosphate synthase